MQNLPPSYITTTAKQTAWIPVDSLYLFFFMSSTLYHTLDN